MGKKDITQKRLEDYSDIFADIINALIFNGQEIVKENELKTVVAKNTYTTEEGDIHEIERDVAKSWNQNIIHLCLFGLENQTTIDKTMPLRIICYDGASYKTQLTNKIKPYPVFTFVLYTGTKTKWNKPLKLSDCFKIKPELTPFFHNYEIKVFNLAWLSDEEIMNFKSEFRNFVEYLRDTRLGRKVNYSHIQANHLDETLQLMRIMTGNKKFADMQKLIHKKLKSQKGAKITMKTTLDALDLAFEEKTKKFALNMFKKGHDLQDISECTETSIDTIKKWIKESKKSLM